MTLNDLITPEVTEGIRLVLLFMALFHVLVGLVLFRFIMSVGRVTQTPYSGVVKLVSTLHILILVGILIVILVI